MKEPKILLRQFEWKKDVQTICEFHKDHIQINFPDSRYKEKLFKKIVKNEYEKEPEGFLIVVDPKTAKDIGFLWLNTRYDPYREMKYGYIHHIHLVPEFRGKGIGTILMKTAEDYFRKKGVNFLQLGTYANNSASVKLFKKVGYKVKRLVMERELG